jgi:hypothetical protein
MAISDGAVEQPGVGFKDAQRIIQQAISECLDCGIDAALVSAVLIGAGVSWYGHHHGEAAILGVLQETIADIQTGRHRVGSSSH